MPELNHQACDKKTRQHYHYAIKTSVIHATNNSRYYTISSNLAGPWYVTLLPKLWFQQPARFTMTLTFLLSSCTIFVQLSSIEYMWTCTNFLRQRKDETNKQLITVEHDKAVVSNLYLNGKYIGILDLGFSASIWPLKLLTRRYCQQFFERAGQRQPYTNRDAEVQLILVLGTFTKPWTELSLIFRNRTENRTEQERTSSQWFYSVWFSVQTCELR